MGGDVGVGPQVVDVPGGGLGGAGGVRAGAAVVPRQVPVAPPAQRRFVVDDVVFAQRRDADVRLPKLDLKNKNFSVKIFFIQRNPWRKLLS